MRCQFSVVGYPLPEGGMAEASVPMSGFIGTIRFEGEVGPFLPFISLGEYLHIGDHTAFGYGHYRIRSDRKVS